MKKSLFSLIIASVCAVMFGQNQAAVTYIDPPTFKNQIYLYGEPNQEDVAAGVYGMA